MTADTDVRQVRVGVAILPERSWERIRARWSAVERLGFDHVWTYDHLTWRWFRDEAWFAAVPTLTAAALETSRIRLGTLVASPNFRHPVPFAKELATLDDIAGGRLIVGIGSGAPDSFDMHMLQRPPWSARERADRFAEFVELTDLLLRQPVTTFEGRYYQAYQAHSHPPCRQWPRAPFAIAAAGPRGMRLAARHGAYWVTSGAPNQFERLRYDAALPLVRQQIAALDEACEAVGREPGSLRRLLVTGAMIGGILDSVEAFRDALGRYAEVGITDVVIHWPRQKEPYQGRVEMLEAVAADLGARAAVDGARRHGHGT